MRGQVTFMLTTTYKEQSPAEIIPYKRPACVFSSIIEVSISSKKIHEGPALDYEVCPMGIGASWKEAKSVWNPLNHLSTQRPTQPVSQSTTKIFVSLYI